MSSHPRNAVDGKYLLLILVAFFLACIPSVLNRSIWTDEVYSMLLLSGRMLIDYPATVTTPQATQDFLHHSATFAQMLHTLIEDDVHPPAYYLLAKAWSLPFGQTLLALRWLSVAIGLVSIVVFARFLWGMSPALARITTPIFAFSTGVMHYSTEVRHYMFSLLGLVLTLYLMGRIIAARDTREGAGAALLAALAAATSLTVLTNYLAIFPLAACYLWFIVLQSNWRSGLISGVCALLVFALWLPFLFQHRPEIEADGLAALSQELYAFDYHAGEVGWQGLPRQAFLVLQGVFGSLYIASHSDYPNVLHWVGRFFFALLIAIGAASAVSRAVTPHERALAWLFILLALAPAAGAMVLYILVSKQLYGVRYLMLAAPGLAALCGMGIQNLYRLNATLGRAGWIAGLALLLSVVNWGYSSSYYQGKTIYRDLAAALQRQLPQRSLVIAGTGPMPGNTTALFHELPADAQVLVLRRDSDLAAVLATAQQYDHVWLVRVRELTRNIEDQLAASLARTWEKANDIEQVEHFRNVRGAPVPVRQIR